MWLWLWWGGVKLQVIQPNFCHLCLAVEANDAHRPGVASQPLL